jgi:membrane-bound ClpP family serine protease
MMNDKPPRASRWLFRAGDPWVIALILLTIGVIVLEVVLIRNDWVTWVIAATLLVIVFVVLALRGMIKRE